MSGDDLNFRRGANGRFAARPDATKPDKSVPAGEPEPTATPEPDTARPVAQRMDARALWLAALAWLSRLPGRIGQRLGRISQPVRWAVGATVLVVLAIVIFLAQPDWDWARPAVASIVSGRVHRPVRIDGHLRVRLFSFTPDARVGGLRIGEPAKGISGAPADDLADIDSIAATTEIMPLFIGRIVLPRLEIDKPVVVMFQDKDGHANWDFSNGAKAGQPVKLPLIRNFIINDGRLTVTSVQRGLKFTGTIYAHEKAGSGRQAFGLTGQGSLNGKVFEMDATGGPLLNVRTSVPYPFDMMVRAGDTRVTAKGRVLHPFNLGQIDAAMTLSGSNLADLYYITGLTLPDTPAYRLAAQVSRDDMVYRITRINGRVGGSDLEGALKVDTRDHGRPDLTGDLSSRLLDFKDLGSVFGATAANAPAAPRLAMAPQATRGAHRLLPDAPLDVARVRGMDARVHYRALSVRAITNMPLRQVSLGIGLDHGLLTLDPIDFAFPRGHLTGTARIDARDSVQSDSIDLRLTGLGVQDFVPKIGGAPPLEGTINARVRASGTGNSVHKAAATADGELAIVMPGGQIRQSFAELMGIDASKGLFQLLTKDQHQTDVRCAIADFKLHNGTMQAQNIVFDTGVVLVKGSGAIDLDDESMKLVFKGKPKTFRLIRINAPIVIGGHLSAPTFGIEPGPAIVQGGIAAALNSFLPFLSLDTAHDANCSALMSEARTEGAATAVQAPPRRGH